MNDRVAAVVELFSQEHADELPTSGLLADLTELDRLRTLSEEGEDVDAEALAALGNLRETLTTQAEDLGPSPGAPFLDNWVRLFTRQRVRDLCSRNNDRIQRAVRALSDEIARMRDERDATSSRHSESSALAEVFAMGSPDHALLMARFMRLLSRCADSSSERDPLIDDLVALCSDALWRIIEYDVIVAGSKFGGKAGGGKRRRQNQLQWILGVVRADKDVATTVDELVEKLAGYDRFHLLEERVWPDVDQLRIEGDRLVAYKVSVDEDGVLSATQCGSWTLEWVARVATNVKALRRERRSATGEKSKTIS